MEAKGVNGQVTFDGRVLTISRAGFFGWATQGRNEKQIPIGSVGAVQLRPPSFTANGLWSVSVTGEVQSSRNPRGVRQISKAGKDENSVIVKRSQVKQFEALNAAVLEALASR
ncbi:DUF4429 domain-containing protein [Brachybacterium massiliense]|uniref:DUF4429 domain-containing protein n=1 Tax=Brachybacterium massiliense TaxID=1755098 RepID=UPI000B3BAEFE|nr:DUF4429 domain-containing protein [Brachybacterium massiliense]